MNNCVLKGRLVADPELRQTPSNISVCKFTVAVDAYAKEGEKKADFIPCTAWRGTADFISKYFTKGQEILVFGALKNNDYTDKDGVKRYGFNLQVSQAEFCGSKSSMAKQLAYIVTLVRHKYGLVSGIYAPAELAALRLYDEKYDKELVKKCLVACANYRTFAPRKDLGRNR